MQKLRHIAFRVLPVLVVAWMAFAVFGGALHTAKDAEPTPGNSLVKAGVGLCAATAAILFSAGTAKLLPSLRGTKHLLTDAGRRPLRILPGGAKPSFAVPLGPLLQVFRT